jgi:hypothetical protein
MTVSTTTERVREHLLEVAENGGAYIKSKHVGDELELNAKQVAAELRKIDRFDDDLELEKWSKSRGACTWRVELNQ